LVKNIYKEKHDFVSLYVLNIEGINTIKECIQSSDNDNSITVFIVNTKLTLEQFIRRTKRFSMILEPTRVKYVQQRDDSRRYNIVC
jgi:hypothetical protein